MNGTIGYRRGWQYILKNAYCWSQKKKKKKKQGKKKRFFMLHSRELISGDTGTQRKEHILGVIKIGLFNPE